MPIKTQIDAWSYSRYYTYRDCPFKAKLTILDGFKEPPNDYMIRGIDLHKKGEDYLKDKTNKVPSEYKMFAKDLKKLKDLQADAEEQICVDKDWNLVEWNDWGKVWGRMKLDAKVIVADGRLKIVDFKSGKVNEDEHYELLDLYSIAGICSYDGLTHITGEIWYLDLGHKLIREYTLKGGFNVEYTESKKVFKVNLADWWMKTIKPMLSDKSFRPNPTYKCKWCHFRKENKGPCKF
jgi:hypothetical protein